MKKIVFILILIAIGLSANSQIVDIPDTDLKNYLIGFNCVDSDDDGVYDTDVDTNNDGEVQVSEAEACLLYTSPSPRDS